MTSPAERTAAIEIAAKLVRRGGKTSVQGASVLASYYDMLKRQSPAIAAEFEELITTERPPHDPSITTAIISVV